VNGGKEEDLEGNSLQMKQKHSNYYRAKKQRDAEDGVKENTLVFKRKVLALRLETRDKIRDLKQVGSPELDRNSVIPGRWLQSCR
jgi:hypothetical protein